MSKTMNLRVKNTGELIVCDIKDWEKAKWVHWTMSKTGVLTNPSGITFENYCGIPGKRRTVNIAKNDYTREAFSD